MDLTTIFYHTDEFCKQFESQYPQRILTAGRNVRKRQTRLILSEVMSIMLYFPYSGYKTFKDYYTKHERFLRAAFPGLVSYSRFVELQQKAAIPMALFARCAGLASCSGLSFIDSSSLKASHVRRQSSHKVFKGLAGKGTTSTGWFYGFKIHFVTTPSGDIIDFYLTSGNVADTNHTVIKRLSQRLTGKVFGDKGYLLSPDIREYLLSRGIQFITKIRSSMKGQTMLLTDRLMLAKRGVIESVIAVLKEDFLLEHTRHRNPLNFFAHICSCIMAYAFKPSKPSIREEFALLA